MMSVHFGETKTKKNYLHYVDYIIFYSIMFKRLLILESDRNSLWIKIVGLFLITLRFADWPYELAFHTLQQQLMSQEIESGSNCLAQWFVLFMKHIM